jgi:DNA-binding LacI/PurR family transcriptional regulator
MMGINARTLLRGLEFAVHKDGNDLPDRAMHLMLPHGPENGPYRTDRIHLMERLRRSYLVEQTATHLRDRLRVIPKGGKLPGVIRLAASLGVSKSTVRSALRMLESEGLIALAEDGLSRTVSVHSVDKKKPFRICILLFDALAIENPRSQQFILETQDHLEQAGFSCFLSSISQCALRHDVGRISRYILKTPADAWMVMAGSYELLGWFVAQKIPCIAFAGRRRTYPIAAVGPDIVSPFLVAVRKLIELGHRRIVFLVRKPMRLPEPGLTVKAFIEEMSAHGIPVSDYNLPDWEETREGMKALWQSLFQVTPPTAVIMADVQLVTAFLQFIGNRRIVMPDRISLVSAEDDPSFEWCDPPIAHIRWDSAPVVRRIVRWASAIRRGQQDLKQDVYPAEFVLGGTIAPAPRS